MPLSKPCFVIWKGARVLRLMQLLKNKREAVATAVSDEWWLMIHTNYISNSEGSKLSVYELEIPFAFCRAHFLRFWHNSKWWSIKKLSARDPQETRCGTVQVSYHWSFISAEYIKIYRDSKTASLNLFPWHYPSSPNYSSFVFASTNEFFSPTQSSISSLH